jgi:hypothetical protein
MIARFDLLSTVSNTFQKPLSAHSPTIYGPSGDHRMRPISTVKVTSETKFCIVGHLDCLIVGLEAKKGSQWDRTIS